MRFTLIGLAAALALVGTPASAGNCIECGRNGAGCNVASKLDAGYNLARKNWLVRDSVWTAESVINGDVAFRAYVDRNAFTLSNQPPSGNGAGWPVSQSKHFLYSVSVGSARKYFYLNGFDSCTYSFPGVNPTLDNTYVFAWHVKGT